MAHQNKNVDELLGHNNDIPDYITSQLMSQSQAMGAAASQIQSLEQQQQAALMFDVQQLQQHYGNEQLLRQYQLQQQMLQSQPEMSFLHEPKEQMLGIVNSEAVMVPTDLSSRQPSACYAQAALQDADNAALLLAMQQQQLVANQNQASFMNQMAAMMNNNVYGMSPEQMQMLQLLGNVNANDNMNPAFKTSLKTSRPMRRTDPTAAGYRPPPKKFHSRRTTFAPCHVAAAMSGKKVNSMAKRPVVELEEVLNSLGTGPRRTLQGLLRTDVHVSFCDDVIGWQRKPPSDLYLRSLIDNIVIIIETQLELTKKRYLSGWKSVYDILRLVGPDTEVGQNHFRAFFTHVIGACDHLRTLPKNSGGRGRDNVLRQNLQDVITHVNSLREYYAQRQAAGLPPVDDQESHEHAAASKSSAPLQTLQPLPSSMQDPNNSLEQPKPKMGQFNQHLMSLLHPNESATLTQMDKQDPFGDRPALSLPPPLGGLCPANIDAPPVHYPNPLALNHEVFRPQ